MGDRMNESTQADPPNTAPPSVVTPMPTTPPPVPRVPRRPPRRRRGCLWGLLVLLLLVVAAGLATRLINVVRQLAARDGNGALGKDEYPRLSTVWSYGTGKTQIARIPIRGGIFREANGGFFGSVDPVDLALRRIRNATHNRTIQGIILEIDSPGGSITASDLLHKAILDFKKSGNSRKVVAVLGNIAASGGYYIAVAADHIIAHPTTVTGSIGVLISTLNFRELGEKVGIHDVTIKSGANKNLLNPFAELTAEQRALLQGVVDAMFDRFVDIVEEGREDMSRAEVLGVADGRVFVAADALDAGLVDQIGYWEDAVEKAAELLGVEAVKVMRYEQDFSFSDLLRIQAPLPLSPARLMQWRIPRILYLWQP